MWMKDFHRRRFLQWVCHQQQHSQDKQQYYHPAVQQTLAITAWLHNSVINYQSDWVEMSMYAQKLVDCGFHSVEMIQNVCTEADVATFKSWMKVIHMRQFLANAGLRTK